MSGVTLPTPRLNSAGNFWKTVPLALMMCVSFIQPAGALDQGKNIRTVTVSGRGIEAIATSLSQINLGVEVQGKTAQDVQKEAARRSSAVVALLQSRNVEKLQTTGISLNPVYSYNNNVQKITGYAASNTVSFRIATDRAGNILDDAVKAGASQISGISFVATDEAIAQAQKQALKKATQEAQQQANVVLDTLGLKAKEVVSVQINGASAPPPITRNYSNAKMMAEAASTPVVGGEQQVEASVTLQISY